MFWDVKFRSRVEKQANDLPIQIQERLFALVLEIRGLGPTRTTWPNYGKIKGRPTYVAVWKVTDKQNRYVEVRYVGTHENADYGRIC